MYDVIYIPYSQQTIQQFLRNFADVSDDYGCMGTIPISEKRTAPLVLSSAEAINRTAIDRRNSRFRGIVSQTGSIHRKCEGFALFRAANFNGDGSNNVPDILALDRFILHSGSVIYFAPFIRAGIP